MCACIRIYIHIHNMCLFSSLLPSQDRLSRFSSSGCNQYVCANKNVESLDFNALSTCTSFLSMELEQAKRNDSWLNLFSLFAILHRPTFQDYFVNRTSKRSTKLGQFQSNGTSICLAMEHFHKPWFYTVYTCYGIRKFFYLFPIMDLQLVPG